MTYKARAAQKGFTLIELAVVIAIIAILAAVAIPRFGNTAATAECSTIKDMASQMNSALAIWTAQNANTPTSFTQFISAAAPTGPITPATPTLSLQNFGPVTTGTCAPAGTSFSCDRFNNYTPVYSLNDGVVTVGKPVPPKGTNTFVCN